MRWGVIVFPGSCDEQDVYDCLKNDLRQKVDFLWHKDPLAGKFDCIVLPGGFFLRGLSPVRRHGRLLSDHERRR